MAKSANAGTDLDEGTNFPRVHNAICFPDLTVFGPEISTELHSVCGSLGWKISTQPVSFLNTHSIYDYKPNKFGKEQILLQFDIGLR